MSQRRIAQALEGRPGPTEGKLYAQVTVSRPFLTTTRVVLSLTASSPPDDLIRVVQVADGSLFVKQGTNRGHLFAAGGWSDLSLTEYVL